MSLGTPLRRKLIPVLAAVLGLGPALCRADAYEPLMAVFTNGVNRLAGSAGYERSLAALEKTLREAGLEPHVQTFDSLAPKTQRCRLVVSDQAVEPVFPINQGVAALVTDQPITGPLLWLGNGSLQSLQGRDVAGRIAMLDGDDADITLENVFARGAKAVILVGGGAPSRWNLSRLSCEGPVAIPCVFVDAETAARGRLRASEGALASLDVKAGLRDVIGRSLWVRIPGKAGATFKLGQEEALVLSASLDTVGLVPDKCPGHREAANAALLADVVTRLARGPAPSRSVVAVFFGAGNWDQEAARHFYYAVGAGSGLATKETIPGRIAFSRQELDEMGRLLQASEREDLLEAGDEETAACVLRLREKLVGWVNNANANLRQMRIERSALVKKPAGARAPGDAARIAALDAAIKDLIARKDDWNAWREHIAKRKRASEGGGDAAAFDAALRSVRDDLRLRQAELERALKHLAGASELAAAFEGKAVVGHFAFDFASAHDPWMLGVLEDPQPFMPQVPAVGSLLLHLSQIGTIYREIRQPSWTAGLLESALTPFYKPHALSIPVERSVPTAVSAMLGIPGFQMMTVGDPMAADGMPEGPACDLRDLTDQMTALTAALANREELSLRRPFAVEATQEALQYAYDGQSYRGLQAVTYSRGSTDIEGAAPNALVRLDVAGRPSSVGVNRYPVARINAAGYVFMPMLNRKVTMSPNLTRVNAVGYDGEGRLERVSADLPQGIESPRIPLFYAYGGGAFAYSYPPDNVRRFPTAVTLDARTEGQFKTVSNIRSLPLQAFYTDRPSRVKRISSNGGLLLGTLDTAPTGIGVAADPASLLALDGVTVSALDAWRLNESRLKALRERGSVNDDLETAHADAGEHLDRAREAGRDRKPRLERGHAVLAALLEQRLYGPLRGVADDLVQAVVLLLLLNIPFALAMERLVFGFTNIYKQVAGVTGFFLLTFGVLFVTHPAFSLASAPIVVFLAFVIILLGGITMKLVLEKINKEILAMQGLASKTHSREGESGTVMAAIMIGVSGMRNRPLKTLLTAVTVILLTFTILAFASFSARRGVVRTDLGRGQDEDRIELHRPSYAPVPPELADAIKTVYDSRCRVMQRGWIFERVIYNPGNGKTAGVGAVLGLEPEETTCNARLARVAPGLAGKAWPHPPLYLPESLAAKLEVTAGQELRINGFPYTYAGPFGAAALADAETIDGFKLLPPDFETTSRNMGLEGGQVADPAALEDLDKGSFAWFSPDRVAMADLRTLVTRYPESASIGYVVMYPKSGDVDLEKTAVEIASAFSGAVHVKSGNGARKLFYGTVVQGSGFGEVIIPLLLGGLIIFSSLMGSIVDREREIFTYSAMGLTPPSVGALFFAESAIYSVVGGMGGYLLGQLTSKTASVLAAHGLAHPPAMNFASLSSMLTIFIVMGVVLLSTAYPALKAGRSANPGVARTWKMPEPVGNRLDFVFPFTVSQADFVGILSFIREHFENHADATLGRFAARNVRLIRVAGTDRLGIEADISLAPFDLGIFQRFRMTAKEFEIKGIEEVVIEIERVAGTPASWRRSNRAFAEELREQFLLWRSLPIETVEHYRRETEKETGRAAGA